MTFCSNLLTSTNPFLRLQLDADPTPAGGGGGDPAPAGDPAPTGDPAPAGTPAAGDVKPFLTSDPEPAEQKTDPVEQTEEQKAAAEEERRAALTDEERAEEDRRAALTDEERAEEDKKKEEENSVPEEYADFEVPDGVTLDPEMTAELKARAKELGLTQSQAQQLADLGVKQMQGFVETMTQQYVDQRNSWRDAALSDKEFGGDAFQENLAHGKAAIETFGSPELKQYLDETGLGDHPEFLRFAIRVGKEAGEHKFVNAGKPHQAKPFYDHPTSQGT